MGRALRDLWLPASVAAVCGLALAVLGMPTPAFTDYELEAETALQALRSGDVAGFLAGAPAYGGSLVLRAPFAFLPDLWGGGDHALFRTMALPCLAAAAVLSVVLFQRARALGGPKSTCWIVLLLVAACPLSLKAIEIGHPEEVLGAALCVGAALAAGSRRPVLAGALLGLAIANKPWAVFAVLPLLAMLPAGRLKLLSVAGAVAGVVMLPLFLDGSGPQMAGAVARDAGTIFQPWQVWWFLGDTGHVVVGNFGVKPDYRVPPEWLTGIAHPLLVGVPLAVSLLLYPRVRRRPWHEGLLLLAFAFLLRCVLDTWNISYYSVPFLLSLAAWELHASRRPPVLSLAAALLAWITLVSIPNMAPPDVEAVAYLAWSVPFTVLLGARLLWPERFRASRALDVWTSPLRARGQGIRAPGRSLGMPESR